jgi:hypothetical protein
LARLGQIVEKIRSKNAGPFWLTVDIFCGKKAVYNRLVQGLSTEQLAAVFDTDGSAIKRFDIAGLNVVKFSLKRPEVQGSVADRDMHGASWAALVGEIKLVD